MNPNGTSYFFTLNTHNHVTIPMNKLGIWAIAIAGAFLVGVVSANPVTEAVGGWQGAFDGLDARITTLEGDASVYEVSETITIQAGALTDGTVTLFCLDGDKLDSGEVNFVTDPAIFVPSVVILSDSGAVFIHDPASITTVGNPILAKRIGYSVTPTLLGSGTPLGSNVDVTVTILCLSPS